jgi:hypothetical protein
MRYFLIREVPVYAPPPRKRLGPWVFLAICGIGALSVYDKEKHPDGDPSPSASRDGIEGTAVNTTQPVSKHDRVTSITRR